MREKPMHTAQGKAKTVNSLRFAGHGLHALAVVFFLVVSQGLKANEGASYNLQRQVLSMLEIYRIAREVDPQLAIARYQVDGAQASKDVARGKFFPQVSVFGDWSENKVRYESDLDISIPSQAYPGERYGLQLRSPLFNMRAYREYERQSFLADQSSSELNIAEADLLRTIVEAVLNVVLARLDVERVETELSALAQQLEEANALYAKSFIALTDVLEAQTRADSVTADLSEARGTHAIYEERLSQLVGGAPIEIAPIAAQFAVISPILSADAAAEMSARSDPAIAAAQDALNAARKGIEREKGSWWPELDFVYISQYSDVGFDNLTSPPRSSESYSISMRYPLFEGGARSARLRAARAEYYSYQYQLEATRRDAEGRARSAWVAFDASSMREKAATQALKTSEVNKAAVTKAVRAGAARVNERLIALAQFSAAQRSLNEAQFQRMLAWLELQLATGIDPEALAVTFSSKLHGD